MSYFIYILSLAATSSDLRTLLQPPLLGGDGRRRLKRLFRLRLSLFFLLLSSQLFPVRPLSPPEGLGRDQIAVSGRRTLRRHFTAPSRRLGDSSDGFGSLRLPFPFAASSRRTYNLTCEAHLCMSSSDSSSESQIPRFVITNPPYIQEKFYLTYIFKTFHPRFVSHDFKEWSPYSDLKAPVISAPCDYVGNLSSAINNFLKHSTRFLCLKREDEKEIDSIPAFCSWRCPMAKQQICFRDGTIKTGFKTIKRSTGIAHHRTPSFGQASLLLHCSHLTLEVGRRSLLLVQAAQKITEERRNSLNLMDLIGFQPTEQKSHMD